ncbi:MAG: hypothetical protein J4F30_05320 [Acidobacteria bacterium]|nr:hypothetical protein [Acidobacteriota bacterium]
MNQSSLAASLAAAMVAAGALACGGGSGETPAAEAVESAPARQAAPAAAAGQAEEGPEGVVNYTRIDATVACAGATPPEAMAELKARGFASVINFRTAGERGATVDAGQAAAEAAGLRYHHLPFREATAEVAEAFLATVGDPSNQPAFIHCGSANRVGAMWLIKRVKQDGWTVDSALAEAETIGLRSEALREFALAYVRDGA